ncbi:MAG: DUF3298 domain-containing protein [Chitinophagaceae bacterium]|nr:DUF3298 domain-containing protein [Chitinophagaceae bacterium]
MRKIQLFAAFILPFLLPITGRSQSSWFKIFTGQIDKYPFTLHLHKAGSSYSGFYYYQRIQQPIYVSGDDTTAGPGVISLLAFVPGATDINERFEVKADTGTGLSGQWKSHPDSAAKMVTAVVNRDLSPRFDFVYTMGDTQLRSKLAESPQASYYAATVWPSGNSAAAQFVRRQVASFFDLKTVPAAIGASLLQLRNNYLADYKKDFRDVPDSDIVSFPSGYTMTQDQSVLVMYQQPQILSLASTSYSYTGGAHGFGATQYVAINPLSQKKYKITDVLLPAGRAVLRSYLEKWFRIQYKLGHNGRLEEAGLFENKIEPNNNFYLTTKGIGFGYAPYEIGPYAMGEINIFIPFNELKSYLQPAFAKLIAQ